MVVVLIKDVLDSCPGSTLIDIRYGWSTYTAMSFIEGAYFLIPKGGSP